ncbi:MAG TPA: polyphosphate kinase 2 [Gemmatimonadales bacterium]|nr:polyphosphate kinase 2 [Gemmatimonadales bacterium]
MTSPDIPGGNGASRPVLDRTQVLRERVADALREVLPADAPPAQELLRGVADALLADERYPIPEGVLLNEELSDLHTSREFIHLLRSKDVDVGRIRRAIQYEEELQNLQIELVKLQRHIQREKLRVCIVIEGRDAAGKGGTIRRFVEHMNPRAVRVVALPRPTEDEMGQWYFQRYMRQLPNRGEIVFFDRSWYNRAVVEPVNGFCTKEQYEQFMRQVPEFEHMLVEDGIVLFKFWFSIAKDVQLARFDSRRHNPLKQWKLSPVDDRAQELWDEYTKFKEVMFSRTHTSYSPWIIVQANQKRRARCESMRHVLSNLDYEGKDEARTSLIPDPNVVQRFHRGAVRID